MVCTEGFRDVIEIRRANKEDLWDTYKDVARPYIPRRDRLTVKERVDAAGHIVVPLDGAGGNLKFTIGSPLQVHDVAKVSARRAPELGEHSEEILKQLGFNGAEIDSLRTSGTVPKARGRAA